LGGIVTIFLEKHADAHVHQQQGNGPVEPQKMNPGIYRDSEEGKA